jgi:hypothetical protein
MAVKDIQHLELQLQICVFSDRSVLYDAQIFVIVAIPPHHGLHLREGAELIGATLARGIRIDSISTLKLKPIPIYLLVEFEYVCTMRAAT